MKNRSKPLAVAIAGALVSMGHGSSALAQIEEIIITAEMRDTGVQDTPLSVTAISGDMIEARNQSNLFEVAAQAPNVNLTPAGSANGPAMLAFIRGVGQTDFNYAVEPGVGIYVDDIFFPTLTGTLMELLDLDRVEILRGPQGTLAGRNSIGGSIKLFSRQPGTDAGNHVSATLGSYNRTDFAGAADFELVDDRLYARVSGLSRSENGYVSRLDYQCMHPDSGVPTFLAGGDVDGCQVGTLGGRAVTAIRTQLRWLPNDRFEVNLSYDRTNDSSEAGASVLRAVNEDVNLTNGWGEGTFIESTIDGSPIYYDNRFVTHGPYRGDPVVNSHFVSYATFMDHRAPTDTRPYSPVAIQPINHLNQDGFGLTVDWFIDDDLSLKWISAYREYDAQWSQNVDNAPIHSQLLIQRLDHRMWSQELRLNGRAFNDLLDYTVGAFHFDQNGTLDANVNLFYAQLNFIHGPDPTPSQTTAFFANTAWYLSDRFKLTLGGRYSRDEKDYVFFRRNPDGTLPGPCTQPGPPAGLGNPANCALSGLFNQTGSFKDDRFDWRVALDYSLTDNVMAYGQVSTGYKAGGINPRPFFIVQIDSVDPEEITSYELGVKSMLLDRRLRLNASVFFNDYTDIQLQQTQCELPFPPFFGAPCLQPGNAGDADVWGVEVEALVDLGNGWMFDASLSTLDFKYTSVSPNVAVTRDMITPFTPELKYSIGVQYEHFTPYGSITPRLDFNYQDGVYTNPTNAETNFIDSYSVLNGRITWRSPGEAWELGLQGNNLTNERYYLNIFDQYFSSGTVEAAPAKPRTYALTIKHRF